MSKARPSRTTNRIHFDDLDPRRFEDLCLNMVHRLNRWFDINHYGRTGSDEGIDIEATEELTPEQRRTWHIQSKRYRSVKKSVLKGIVDVIIDRAASPPGVLLLIITCDVSKANIDYFKSYASSRGISIAIVWTASIIEAKLYAEYHDLLFAYFGVNLTGQRRDKIASLRRNLRLKKQMHRDLLTGRVDPQESLRLPYLRFDCTEILIHSIDDKYYPDADPTTPGISGWFKVEPYSFYHNGIEVILGIQIAVTTDNQSWDIVDYYDTETRERYNEARVFEIGRIPFENIVDYDVDGDEYYSCPHIYCDFRNSGRPYEEIVYSTVVLPDDSVSQSHYPWRLDNRRRVTLGRPIPERIYRGTR